MKLTTRTCAIALVAGLVVFGGCSEKKSEQAADSTSPAPQPQPSQAAPAPQQPPAVTPDARPTPEPSAPTRPVPAQKEPVAQPEKKDPAPVTPPAAAVPQPKPEPAPPVEQKPPATSTPQKPAAAEAKKAIAKDVVVLTGSPLGGVRFEHKLHATRAANACETCHHASKPEKPATAPQQACSECHTKVATAPMKTKYQAAFHNPMAQTGTCVDCHKAENAKGKKAPVKCAECHKKENA